MVTTVQNEEAKATRLASEQVWRKVAAKSFAVLGYVTPRGEPRASGVVYKTLGRRLYVAVAPDSWKARHIAVSGLPTERRASASIIEVIPEGEFVTYGLGMSLAKMRDPTAARSRVRVEETTRR